jgi:hypothetical protein
MADNIFVYLGGEQEVPADVTHVIIDRSVKIIPERAFYQRMNMVSVETHGGLEKIEKGAFQGCHSLRGIKLPGVKEVGYIAFINCIRLMDVEFGDKLETIEEYAFACCPLRRSIVILPIVRTIGERVFGYCKQLTDVYALLKKDMTLLELALWKAKLDESDASEEDTPNGKAVRNIDVESVRKELRVVSGADIIIKNVLPFLKLG